MTLIISCKVKSPHLNCKFNCKLLLLIKYEKMLQKMNDEVKKLRKQPRGNGYKVGETIDSLYKEVCDLKKKYK